MEIEIRAFVDSFREVRDKIINLGGRLVGSSDIVDFWFCLPESTCFEDIAMKEKGDFGLRIRRKVKSDGAVEREINCKVLRKREDHNAFEEIATPVEDEEAARSIFEAINLKEFCRIKKKRTTYKLRGLSVNLEDIENFKPVIEIEKISDSPQEIKKHKREIRELLQDLGIPKKDVIKRSITYLYMKENSNFD